MASTFRLKRKCFGEYGEAARKALIKGKAAGLTGKELQNYVSLNSGSSFAGAGLGNKFGGPTVIQANNAGVTTGGNMVSLTGQTNAKYGKTYKGGADNAFKNVTTQQTNIAKREAQRAAQRAANQANPGRAAAESMRQRMLRKNQPATSTINSSTLKNTWKGMGTMGKVGTGAAVAAGGYFLGKGLGLWGNKNKK